MANFIEEITNYKPICEQEESDKKMFFPQRFNLKIVRYFIINKKNVIFANQLNLPL